MWQFPSFSLKDCVSVYIFQKSQELWKILKTLSSSSPIFALSNHTTFSQAQTGATVPLSIEQFNTKGSLPWWALLPGMGGYKVSLVHKSPP
jgi:hypothetical protein